MSNAFDPYHTWLGISPAEQPPNHYRLLGVALFENSQDVISNAADRQMAHIRTFQSGKYSAESQKLLNELSSARVTLLDPKKRATYDAKLRTMLYPAGSMPGVMPNAMPGTLPGAMPGQYPMGMAPQMGQPMAPMGQPMAPQMGQPMAPQMGQPMAPQMGQSMAPMGQSLGPVPQSISPQPITPSPLPIGTKHSTIKKHTHGKEDPTKYYAIGGVVAVALLLIGFLLFSGKSSGPEQIAETPSETTKASENSEINPEDFNMDEEMPERSVQEHILNDPTPDSSEKSGKTEKNKDENSFKTPTIDDENEVEDGDSSKKSHIKSNSDLEEESEAKDSDESDDDSDDSTEADSKSKQKTEEDSDEESTGDSAENSDAEDSGTKKDSSEKTDEGTKEKAETDSGISNEEIQKLGSGISLRLEPKRAKMLKYYGAEAQIQEQIDLAVSWLLEKMIRQTKQGVALWNFDHTLAKKGAAKKSLNPGLAKTNLISSTSLSMMAIMGSGTIDLKEKQNLSRAVNFLLLSAKPVGEQQILPIDYEEAKKKEASLVIEESEKADFHPHAWGTIAVCNYIALTKEMKDRKEKHLEQYTEFAQALVRHISKQQNLDGGFPLLERGLTVDCTLVSRRSEHSSSIISTVWNLLAMQAAEDAGLAVPKATIEKATGFLSNKVMQMGRNRPHFLDLSKTELREIRTALYGIQLFGEDFPTYAESANLVEQILKIYDSGQLQENFITTLYTRDLRGESWEKWKEEVLVPAMKSQNQSKNEKGSWYFPGDLVNEEGGRLYCTAMTALMLEGFYYNAPTRPLEESEEAAKELGDPDAPAFNIPRDEEEDDEEEGGNAGKAGKAEEEEEPEAESFLGEGNSLEFSTDEKNDEDDEE